jgi:hypothetical protein
MEMSFLQKIKEVFTKEYKQETEYRDFVEKNVNRFKLKSEERLDLSERLKSLEDNNFQSNFQVKADSNSTIDVEDEYLK